MHDTGLWDLAVIVGKGRRSDSAWKFVHVGPANTAFDEGWRRTAAGTRTTHMPDPEYGPWVTPIFDRVTSSGAPLHRHNSARIRRRGANDQERWAYSSLDLPCCDENGHRFIVTVSARSPAVSLTLH